MTKNILIMTIFIMVICGILLCMPISAAADNDELAVQINIYQGDTYAGTVNVYAFPGEDINIISLNDVYGTP